MKLLPVMMGILAISSCTHDQVKQRNVVINLSGQQLKEIPDTVYQNAEISHLDLGSSNITFYPPLSSFVDTNSNEISFISERIGMLKKLKTLILNTNNLTTLPESIAQLSNLEVLDLSINRDLDVVQELDKLKQLPKLKMLKIVDVSMKSDDLNILKSTLRHDIKIIVSAAEYMETLK